MDYLVGSALPPVASYRDRELRWELVDVTGETRLSYRLRPQAVGTWPTNLDARAKYRDGLGYDGELVFPVPRVVVVAPAKPIYLPLSMKDHCRPRERHADVALVIDTSSSMTGDKLAAAKAAARAFVDLLDLPRDQAAVIGFNASVTVAAPLSGDRAGLHGAIESLFVVPGTVVDAGIRAGTREVTGTRALPGNNRVIVLLTDGQNNAGPGPVTAAADDARRNGVVIYSIAFGADADRALMRQVAGDPKRAYVALSASDLERIYQEIAGKVGCAR
jgi:Ca-activated chloride channel family protein